MIRFTFASLVVALAALIAGCAHPISVTADSVTLVGTGAGKLDKSAGLNISAEDKQREVIGPGGGGDKLSYFPYRDLETGIYIALSEKFSKVVRVNGVNDPAVKTEGLHYVVTPRIATTSFSPSPFTWPPTIFTVEITGAIVDADGKTVTELRATGDGRAEFEEFKGNFSLAAKRAANDVLKKLIKALDEAPSLLR